MSRLLYLIVLTAFIQGACTDAKPTETLGGNDADSDADGDADSGADGDTDADVEFPSYDPLGFEGDGPFEVLKVTPKKFQVDGRPLFIAVPGAGGEIAADDGPFPVVIVHPYALGTPSEYNHFSNHIASHGFIVVGVNYPENSLSKFLAGGMDQELAANHTVRTIDWLLGAENEWRDLVDPSHIVTAGHSVGGKIATYAATLDARITDVIAWDPVDTGGPPCGLDQIMPNANPPYSEVCARWPVGRSAEQLSTMRANLLLFGGNTGGVLSCNPEGFSHHDYFSNIPETINSLHIIFSESEHLDWRVGGSNPLNAIADLVCDSATRPAVTELVHRVAKRTNVAWLLKYTKDREDVDEYLDPNGPVMEEEINSGAITVEWN